MHGKRVIRRNVHGCSGFTLIELLLVIGIIGVLASVVIVAVNPTMQLTKSQDAKRQHNAKQLKSAMYQYLIEEGQLAGDKTIPEGEENAEPICSAGYSGASCINLDALVPDYMAALPTDSKETDPNHTGYSIYKQVGRPFAQALYIGQAAMGTGEQGGGGGGGSSASAGSTPASTSTTSSSSSSSSLSSGPWLAGWGYRKKITIDSTNVDSDLSSFPLYVKLNADTDVGAAARSDCYDIRFTTSDMETEIPYERESCSVTGGAATGHFWVKIPTVASASNTEIYAYYGKSDATDGQSAESVWDGNFAMVQHMNEDPSGTAPQMIDSTSNGNNGTSNGSMTAGDLVAGKIGNALDFDGSDDYVGGIGTTSSFTHIHQTGIFTIALWAKTDNAGATQYYMGNTPTSFEKGFYFGHVNTGKVTFGQMRGGGSYTAVNSTSAVGNDTSWHHIALKCNGTICTLYDNGIAIGADKTLTAFASGNATRELNLGRIANYTSEEFDGLLDEVRISTTARTADWIKFEYNNMNASDQELSWSGEESA